MYAVVQSCLRHHDNVEIAVEARQIEIIQLGSQSSHVLVINPDVIVWRDTGGSMLQHRAIECKIERNTMTILACDGSPWAPTVQRRAR